MLVSETSALEASMRSGELERQFRRLSLYVERLSNINMQATLIAGFAFSATSPDILEVIMDDVGPLSTIYVVLIFISISISCWVVTVSLNSQIKAEKLAMEGPDGSVRYALAAIIKVSDLIAQLHSCAAACLGGAVLTSIWSYLPSAVAATLTVLIAFLLVHAVRYSYELDALFSLEGKRLVGRGEHLQRALLVAAREDEERASTCNGAGAARMAEPLLDPRGRVRAPNVPKGGGGREVHWGARGEGAPRPGEPSALERAGSLLGSGLLRWAPLAPVIETERSARGLSASDGGAQSGDAAFGPRVGAPPVSSPPSTCSESTASLNDMWRNAGASGRP